MRYEAYAEAAIAHAALELLPPLIRDSLLEDARFRRKYAFALTHTVSLGVDRLVVHSSELFSAVRDVLSGSDSSEFRDTSHRVWSIQSSRKDGHLPTLFASSEQVKITLSDFVVLASHASTRLRAFDQMAREYGLPREARAAWHDTLSQRSIEDEEFGQLLEDIQTTPCAWTEIIRNEFRFRRGSVASLVPSSRRYFERLVGVYDESGSIEQYAARVARPFFESLSDWKPYEGFLHSLLLSSHSSITAEISVARLGHEHILHSFEFLVSSGDDISRLGAIEVGFRILADIPEIEPYLIKLIEYIRDDPLESVKGSLKVLSALFVLVDGELSRIRTLAEFPPFYRRLASLSQAALIQRQIGEADGVKRALCAWAFDNRGEHYYLQSLTDMRLEPRWDPDRGMAEQLKADFISRIVTAARKCEHHGKGREIFEIALGKSTESLESRLEFPRSFFPGPLEGDADMATELPSGLSKNITERLSAEEITLSSFFGLVNSARLFAVAGNQLAATVEAVRKATHRLTNVESREELLSVLDGLATVAAANRSKSLADELRRLVRRYRLDARYRIGVREAFRICLIAAASRSDLDEWREFVGDWLTELAFEELDDDDAAVLRSHVMRLCHSVPELWVSCGRAEAALAGIIGR